ncbi:hypothetical protein [uncultured Thiothrix sp.]|uniref:hypothetical protein n=1 Tax=uncultured Thiothrix sp. TaxID=223185 RepID=UPI00263A02F9|nr:hypothetical protein [uncultured Thiothrix sp.]
MFKKALSLSLVVAGLCLSSLASAENYMYENNDWEQPEYYGNPGGHFSIHVVPPVPPRYAPPRYYEPPPRCVPGHQVDQMQAGQSSQIYAGRQEGDLTRSEMESLLAQQDHIASIEERMRRDGCLTLQERNDLVARLNQASRDIWRERNDNERRGEHHRPHYGGWSSDRY